MKTIPHIPHHEWSDVERIAIHDNQEALIAVPTSRNLKQRPMYFEQNVPHAINVCAARTSVVEKLQLAADLLPEGLGIVVLDAWRSRDVQQALQDQVGDIIKATYPDLSPEEQQKMLLQFVAPVGPNFVSPHLTGGSVDITLYDLNTGAMLDMGSDFDEPSERSHTAYYENTPSHPAHERRRLLHHVMTEVGFSNLPTEWWHFDFGNPLWAHYTGQDHALYGASHWQDSAAAVI